MRRKSTTGQARKPRSNRCVPPRRRACKPGCDKLGEALSVGDTVEFKVSREPEAMSELGIIVDLGRKYAVILDRENFLRAIPWVRIRKTSICGEVSTR